jgi:hypothetical protein
MQIIAGAIIVGALIFLGIAVFLVHNNQGQGVGAAQGQLPVVSLVALAMLCVQTPLAFLIPAAVVSKAVSTLAGHAPDTYVAPPSQAGPGGLTSDRGYLLGVYQTAMIISLALFEGASFLGSIAYLLEGRPFALAVSGIAILLLASRFPTEDGIRNWLDGRLREVDEQRSQKGTYRARG